MEFVPKGINMILIDNFSQVTAQIENERGIDKEKSLLR